MAVSKAQQKAVAKYEAKAYDKALVRLPKGRLDEIKSHAASNGESVNAFIGRAISETMERDGIESPVIDSTGSNSILAPETLKAAQKAAEATGETTSRFLARAVDTQAQRDKMTRKLEKS